MKIEIDERTIADAVSANKLDLVEWLLDQNCPVNSQVYSLAQNVTTLNWILAKGVKLDKKALIDAIPKTNVSLDVLKWFSDKVAIDSSVTSACIKYSQFEFLDYLLQVKKVKLDTQAFIAAAETDHDNVLDYVKANNVIFNETVLDYAIRYGKKNSIKWLARNNYI